MAGELEILHHRRHFFPELSGLLLCQLKKALRTESDCFTDYGGEEHGLVVIHHPISVSCNQSTKHKIRLSPAD